MSSKIINKMMGAIGLIDDEDNNEVDNKEENDVEEYVEPEIINRRNNKIVSIKTNSTPKVLLKKPSEFQDIMEIVDAVKARKIIVMNISEVESRLAQRMIDYIVGACYALNGSFEEISRLIYVIAPDNVEITNDLKQELNKSGFFSFQDRGN
jgi:cell division inhibitor SepF